MGKGCVKINLAVENLVFSSGLPLLYVCFLNFIFKEWQNHVIR